MIGASEVRGRRAQRIRSGSSNGCLPALDDALQIVARTRDCRTSVPPLFRLLRNRSGGVKAGVRQRSHPQLLARQAAWGETAPG